jgi:hypothetical protein
MLNLRCEGGHRYYSPQPEAWIGKQCLKQLGDRPSNRCYHSIRQLPKRRRPRARVNRS